MSSYIKSFVIRGNTPSKKNNKVSFCFRGCTGWVAGKRPAVTHSSNFKEWHKPALEALKLYWRKFSPAPIDGPVVALVFFYRQTARIFDYSNMGESIADLLIEAGVIADDNCNFFRTVPVGHRKDKDNPRSAVWLFRAGDGIPDVVNETSRKAFIERNC